MITIKADFNHRDERGRLLLADLVMHGSTPFESIAARTHLVTFIDGEHAVSGSLEFDATRRWVGLVDWSTQQTSETWPSPDHISTPDEGRETSLPRR